MYAELKCKTNFSFLDGASQPDELVDQAAVLGLTALAITDLNGVYGMPKAYWRAKEHPQLKFIVGAEVTISNAPSITLLARDRQAYGLMCRILTQSHAGKEKGMATLTLDELSRFMDEPISKGLFCIPTVPPLSSESPQANPPPFGDLPAVDFLTFLKMRFEDRLFLPLSRFKDGHDEARTARVLQLSRKFDARIVATNDVLYHSRTRKPLQDAFVAIREGKSLLDAGFKLSANGERYLKSPQEMAELFADLPEALENTLLIANQCTFSPSELRYRYPSEWIPEPHTAQSYLEELTWAGAKERFKDSIVPDNLAKQIHHELTIIHKLGYPDYFLTIYDIVRFAIKENILCQGRGSAANSAVCYCLGITAIDPVKGQLLFERFISEERKEPPDIDVDFEHSRREEVIQYIYKKYGRDRAGMVSAVITYRKRSAFRELSKAFGVEVGSLSSKAMLHEWERLEKTSPIPNCREKIDQLATEMKGFPRHLSIHSGGFTLSADPIIEIVPIEPARKEGRTIIQWDKYDLDYLGLLKIDVLSLGMLTALKKTLDMVNLKLYEIPQDDKKTYEMIQKADTIGTFQVESRAQMNMSGRLLAKNFYDLVIQVAIVRPGPSVGQMVHPFLKRRNGIEQAFYPHPKLREILGKTLGVPLFQEQLMRIAVELAEFTPGEADQLRRAIGAWRSSGSIQDVAQRLLTGLKKNGIPDDYAKNLLEHMKGFAHYGFPESHAASFALLAYASCYLKRHHPAEFACGLLNSQPMGFYAAHTLVDDAKRHGVTVLPVDPNHSQWECTIEKINHKSVLRMGLRIVHGLDKKEAQTIIQNKPYQNMSEFLAKTQISKDVLYRLAMGDAFRSFGEDPRHTLWKILEEKVQKTENQLDLFAGATFASPGVANTKLTLFDSFNAFESVKADYGAFNLSTQAHPMQALRKIKKLPRMTTFDAKRTPPKTKITTAGLLLVRQMPPTANGVCFGAIEDEHGFLDLVLFKEDYEKCKPVFLFNCFLIVSGYIEREGHSVSMIVKNVEPIWDEDAKEINGLVIEPTQYFW